MGAGTEAESDIGAVVAIAGKREIVVPERPGPSMSSVYVLLPLVSVSTAIGERLGRGEANAGEIDRVAVGEAGDGDGAEAAGRVIAGDRPAAPASNCNVLKLVMLVPKPDSAPALAADASSRTPPPPSTLPEKTAPGSTISRLA